MENSESAVKPAEPAIGAEPIVAFYLTLETDLPSKIRGHDIVPFEVNGPAGEPIQKRSLRITFSQNTSIEQPVCVLTLGSDPQQCKVILNASDASPVHCKVYAQLNSGPRMWVLEDNSSTGTQYYDDESLRKNVTKTVAGRREAAEGLHVIKIGRYLFRCYPPKSDAEVLRRESWFDTNEPIPVTDDILRAQLRGVKADFKAVCKVGQGGNGEVFKYLERKTGLLVAFKVETVKGDSIVKRSCHEKWIQKEINLMKTLKHPLLVGYLVSYPTLTLEGKKWFTAMPLYQGSLYHVLPGININSVEQIMTQVIDALLFMHGRQILHRDVKPENILISRKSPLKIVLSDYGIATSLLDRASLTAPCGTPGFSGPEVVRGVEQTTAVDVYSLGATLYVILEFERMGGLTPKDFAAALENFARYPPKVYAGLVQSMMASSVNERPSLLQCRDIVTGRDYKWTRNPHLVQRLNAPFRPAQGRALLENPAPNRALAKRQRSPPKSREAPKQASNRSPPRPTAKEKSVKRVPVTKDTQPMRVKKQPARPVAPVRRADICLSPSRPDHSAMIDFNEPQPAYAKRTNIFANLARQNEGQFLGHRYKPSSIKRLVIDRNLRAEGRHLFDPKEQTAPRAPVEELQTEGKPAEEQLPIQKPDPLAIQAPGRARIAKDHPSLQRSRHGETHTQQKFASTHESSRSKISKDNIAKIRRSAARREMIYRYAAINKKTAQLRRGIVNAYQGVRRLAGDVCDLAGDVRDIACGAWGLPHEVFTLLFSDAKSAMRALKHAAPEAGLGLNAEGRLMYGLRSREFKPLSPAEYEHERLQSYINFPNTEEGRRIIAYRERLLKQEREAWAESRV